MRLKFTSDCNIQVADAEGMKAYEFRSGETTEVPADIAAIALAQGAAEPVKSERATKTKE